MTDGKKNKFKNYCFDNKIMEYFSKANLFIFCCIAACFSLITYLAAFSCEVSWLLESRGDLPTAAHLLCAGYFVLFVASTILIHGLVTGLPWGLFSWSIIIGILAIPELCLVMYMTTQYWGLQSTHGLTEIIAYLIRLIVNCLALLCVIPTAIRWRREQQVLIQLKSLANRLQLSTPVPNSPMDQGSKSLRGSKRSLRRPSGFDNPAFLQTEPQFHVMSYPYGSQNEFNASIFGLNASQYIGPVPPPNNTKRTQSLLDLRYIIPPTSLIKTNLPDKNFYSLMTENESTKNKLNYKTESIIDPIYYTIEANNKGSKSLGRNCISLENLGGITDIKNELNAYGNNLLQNNFTSTPWSVVGFPSGMHNYPVQYYHMPFGYVYDSPYKNASNTNSKQSLGNESDDYRKYRDVAL